MRVGILSQYFEPEPVPRLTSLVRHLVEAGHVVEVLTAIPNWPGGSFYPGYRGTLIKEEERLGARVIRSYVWPYRGSITWKRLLHYGSFVLSALRASHRLTRLDVLYVYHPPLTISLIACFIARRQAIPFVYDVQDIWPEAGLAAGALQPGRLYRFMSAWARWAYARATRITVIAPEFAEVVVKQGAAREKISVVPNWADDALYYPRMPDAGMRQLLGLAEHTRVVMYAGNLGSTHGVEIILQAAQLLKEHTHILFVFAGTGPEYDRMVYLKKKLDLTNVLFLGYVQPARMPELLSVADLLVVHLRKSASGAVSVPSRMLAYMASGRPMLVASEGAPRALVERLACGIACEPENAEVLSESISYLLSHPEILKRMGENGRRHYLAEFAEDKIVNQLMGVIQTASELPPSHRPGRDYQPRARHIYSK